MCSASTAQLLIDAMARLEFLIYQCLFNPVAPFEKIVTIFLIGKEENLRLMRGKLLHILTIRCPKWADTGESKSVWA